MKRYAKHLQDGDVFSRDGEVYTLARTVDYGNGWLALLATDGECIDILAYATVAVLGTSSRT